MRRSQNTDFAIQDQDIPEIPERLDEQHIFTTKTLGFLIHPNIPRTSPTLKVADIGAGTGIWLVDVAKNLLPVTCELTGFDTNLATLPPRDTWPANVTFKEQDMFLPFPADEVGTYDIVAARFVTSAATREEWKGVITNVMTLLKPGGWLQWIDSCNFAVYNTVAGTSREACKEVYAGLDPFRAKDDLVIGLMIRDAGDMRREEILRECGLVEVHEDIFSTDKLQEPDVKLRDSGTRNILECFLGCLEALVGKDESEWTKEKIEQLKGRAMKEIDNGVYHTLDQVCMVGKKP